MLHLCHHAVSFASPENKSYSSVRTEALTVVDLIVKRTGGTRFFLFLLYSKYNMIFFFSFVRLKYKTFPSCLSYQYGWARFLKCRTQQTRSLGPRLHCSPKSDFCLILIVKTWVHNTVNSTNQCFFRKESDHLLRLSLTWVLTLYKTASFPASSTAARTQSLDQSQSLSDEQSTSSWTPITNRL